MVPNYKNIQLSCRLHAHPPWQFCKWCQPELSLYFNTLTHVKPASSDSSRLAPAVSYSEKARSSAWVFNSRVNRAHHANLRPPNKTGKADQVMVLISFWISSCGLYSPAWATHNLFNWTRPLSSLIALFFSNHRQKLGSFGLSVHGWMFLFSIYTI